MGIKFLTTKQLAARWGWNSGSIANMRAADRGPKHERIGWTVVYAIADVEAYERRHPEVLQKVRQRRR